MVKQSLPRLRVADEWLAKRERAVTEACALELAAALMPGAVPRVLDLDREACAFTIERAPGDWQTWKDDLLEGRADADGRAPGRAAPRRLARGHHRRGDGAGIRRPGGIRPATASTLLPHRHARPPRPRRRGRRVRRAAARPRSLPRPRRLLAQERPRRRRSASGSSTSRSPTSASRASISRSCSTISSSRLCTGPAAAPATSTVRGPSGTRTPTTVPRPARPDPAASLGQVGCLMIARVDGKSPAEYLSAEERNRARSLGRRLLAEPPRRARRRVRAVATAAAGLTAGTGSRRSPRARSSTRAGVRPSRPMSGSTAARSVGRASRRAPRPAGMRRSSFAIATRRASAAWACAARSETSRGDRAGGGRTRRARPGWARRGAGRARRHPRARSGSARTPCWRSRIATARAAAAARRATALAASGRRAAVLPLPMVNILSGGLHAPGGLAFQDFLVVPVGAGRYSEALEMVYAVRSATEMSSTERGLSTLKADEGGFGPALERPEQALDLLVRGDTARAGYRPGDEVAFAVDVAATTSHRDGSYDLAARRPDRRRRSSSTCSRDSSTATRSSRSRTASARTTGRDGRSSRARLGARVQLDRRRPLHDEPRAARAWHRRGRRQRRPREDEPDRDADRDDRGDRAGPRRRLRDRRLRPFGRDGGPVHRRPRRGDRRRPDQDRLARPVRAARQVQPAPPDRGGARPDRCLRQELACSATPCSFSRPPAASRGA